MRQTARTTSLSITVQAPAPASDDDYTDYTLGNRVVLRILDEETEDDGRIAYDVEFRDRHTERVRLGSGKCSAT